MLKKLMIIIVLALFVGCATVPQVACPPEDAYYMIRLPNGQQIPVFVEKDWFNENRHLWKTQEEFDEFMEEYRKRMQGN